MSAWWDAKEVATDRKCKHGSAAYARFHQISEKYKTVMGDDARERETWSGTEAIIVKLVVLGQNQTLLKTSPSGDSF